MAIVQLILAVTVGVVAAVLFLLAQFSSWSVRVHMHLVHDLAGTLGIVRLARHLGNDSGVDAGLNVLAGFLRPEDKETVRLRSLVKSLLGLFEAPKGCELDWSLGGDLMVSVQPKLVHALLANLLLNATEAACAVPAEDRAPVTVDIDDHRLQIKNVARPEALAALAEGAGSTTKKESGHGIGRQSVERCCDLLGWEVRYEVKGFFVVTTVCGFEPAE